MSKNIAYLNFLNVDDFSSSSFHLFPFIFGKWDIIIMVKLYQSVYWYLAWFYYIKASGVLTLLVNDIPWTSETSWKELYVVIQLNTFEQVHPSQKFLCVNSLKFDNVLNNRSIMLLEQSEASHICLCNSRGWS